VSTLSPSRSPSPARDVPRHLDCNLAGVVVPWDERLIRPPFTVEVWAKVPATEPTSVLVAIGPPNSGDRWQLAVSADGQIVADVGGRTPGNVRSDAKAADGGFYNKVIKQIPNVSQTLGLSKAEFTKMGLGSRDVPNCP